MRMFFIGRRVVFFSVLFVLIFSCPIYSKSAPKNKFELKISGGMTTVAGGNWNANIEGWSDLRKQNADLYGNTFTSNNNLLDWGWEAAGEILFNLSSQFALSAGLGYIKVNGSGIDTTVSQGSVSKSTFNTAFKGVPVTLGLYYQVPLSSKSSLSIGAGSGYYFTSFDYNHYREDGLGSWIHNDQKGNSGGIGFHGGIGYEYSVSKSISVIVEAFGRYAKINGFEGTRSRYDSNNWSDSDDVAFYYVEREQLGFGWFQRVVASIEEPTGSQVRNVRSAEIDFSGLSVRIGLKIKLF